MINFIYTHFKYNLYNNFKKMTNVDEGIPERTGLFIRTTEIHIIFLLRGVDGRRNVFPPTLTV